MIRAGRSLRAAALIVIMLAAACGGDEPAPAASDTADTAGTAVLDEGHDDDGDHGHGASQAPAEGAADHDHADESGADADDGHDHDHDHDHGAAGEPTRYDADVADAVQTITVDAVDGAPVDGVRRVEVDLGSVVALMVASDIAEEVHVHGYDILRAVSDGHPAHFAFTAEIPGVFEVEFEGSGRLLLLLEIS